MTRFLAGGIGAILLLIGGWFLWQGFADQQIEIPAAPPPDVDNTADQALPVTDITGLKGPKPPEATEMTREQRRFARYDRNFDQRITRAEMLSSRTKAFKKLDRDGNNLLTFEEWAVATSDRFAQADGNRDGELDAKEFITTKPKPVKKPVCSC